MKKDPVELQQLKKERKVRERARHKVILDMADSFDILWEYEHFKPFLEILKSSLAIKKKDLDDVKNESVENILKDKERYLMKRTELEAEVRQLMNILEIREKYRSEADRVLKPSSPHSRGAKKREAGG